MMLRKGSDFAAAELNRQRIEQATANAGVLHFVQDDDVGGGASSKWRGGRSATEEQATATEEQATATEEQATATEEQATATEEQATATAGTSNDWNKQRLEQATTKYGDPSLRSG
jgi:methyl-accepting chemotaxis protein